MSRHKVLFATHDWGLGHATRDLVLIRALLDAGNEVSILSAGRALELLRQELGQSCEFLELKDIPKPLSTRATWFYIKMTLALPAVFWTFRREHQLVDQLCRDRHFDRIISDTRYGVCTRDVPSFYLVHSLRQIIPGRPRRLEHFVETAQLRMLSGASRILIPDDAVDGLAGDLCHDVDKAWNDRIEYIGILSSVQRMALQQDVDYFISVSGAEPQRSIFERIVLEQVHELPGRVVVTLGRPDQPLSIKDDGHVAIYSYLNRQQQQEMMNRARLVVSRSGYTTLMELAELGKRALLIPTVGQSEQEYLAAHHKKRGNAYSVLQSDLNLARDVATAETYAGLPRVHPTDESISRFLTAVAA